jgi:hypothetical protein
MLKKQKSNRVILLKEEKEVVEEAIGFREIELMLYTIRYLIFYVALILITLILVASGYGELIPKIIMTL